MSLTIRAEPVPLESNADGVVCARGTRVTLDTIVAAFKEGATAEEIAQQYPTVVLPDIYAIIGFYLRQRSEVEAYLEQRMQRSEAVRRENESRFDPDGVRDRLLARRTARQ